MDKYDGSLFDTCMCHKNIIFRCGPQTLSIVWQHCATLNMPRSREKNAARMREQREAEARAQEKVVLQSEVMPKARSEARSAVTQKKLADEAAAFAAAVALQAEVNLTRELPHQPSCLDCLDRRNTTLLANERSVRLRLKCTSGSEARAAN